jgi:hypothetical protein
MPKSVADAKKIAAIDGAGRLDRLQGLILLQHFCNARHLRLPRRHAWPQHHGNVIQNQRGVLDKHGIRQSRRCRNDDDLAAK